MVTGLDVDAGLREVQLAPSFTEYWMLVMADPPFAPSANATSTRPSPGVTEMMAGIDGTVEGVPFVAVLAAPLPRALTARILIAYVVPFVNDETVKDPLLTAVDSAVQVDPPSSEYS